MRLLLAPRRQRADERREKGQAAPRRRDRPRNLGLITPAKSGLIGGMFVDLRAVPEGTDINSEICIVGAGAAGITIARELNGSGVTCVLLESGGTEFDSATQQLYAGDIVGRPFLDLTTCRLRHFGGTTNHWSGWCMPLEPIDFETREGLPYRGWPVGGFGLYRWYRRAQEVCQIGPFDYEPEHWGVLQTKLPAPFRGPHFVP